MTPQTEIAFLKHEIANLKSQVDHLPAAIVGLLAEYGHKPKQWIFCKYRQQIW